ncbi:hypothetical protein P7H06_00090 [Paenibacillus larvae]|nr:hypothetical protein [Paenibacillus larvae]MDT2258290.1 hypothetical protein [Paenibacillus larvae]
MTFKKLLSTEQYTAIGYLALPKAERHTQRLPRYGVHPNTIGNWRKDRMFEAELKRQMVRNSRKVAGVNR